MPVPLPPTELPVISSESSDSEHPEVQGSATEYKPSGGDSPQPFSQVELYDLTRDLGLSKEAAVLLGSRLKEKTYWLKEPLFIGTGIEKRNLLSTLRKRRTWSIVLMFPD